MNSQIGSIIKIARQNRNMSQEDLAEKLSITSQAVSKWERNISIPDTAVLGNLCKILDISADVLLGISESSYEAEKRTQHENNLVFQALNASWPAFEIYIGCNLVPIFSEINLTKEFLQVRIHLAKEGFLVPVIHIKDFAQIEPDEFVILSSEKVLHNEILATPEVKNWGYVLEVLEKTIRQKYEYILSPDITKLLVDNLCTEFPTLVEGVIPDVISYHKLTEILKEFVKRGNTPKYLHKIIEISERRLRSNPDSTVIEIVDEVLTEISSDNIWIFLANRN